MPPFSVNWTAIPDVSTISVEISSGPIGIPFDFYVVTVATEKDPLSVLKVS